MLQFNSGFALRAKPAHQITCARAIGEGEPSPRFQTVTESKLHVIPGIHTISR